MSPLASRDKMDIVVDQSASHISLVSIASTYHYISYVYGKSMELLPFLLRI
jgi:hypothetical protein